jgi:hypothetical protein
VLSLVDRPLHDFAQLSELLKLHLQNHLAVIMVVSEVRFFARQQNGHFPAVDIFSPTKNADKMTVPQVGKLVVG